MKFLLNHYSIFISSRVYPVLQKRFKEKKRPIESTAAYDSVVHKSKKRKGKKVELIDDLENKYEAKIARSQEEAETVDLRCWCQKAQKKEKEPIAKDRWRKPCWREEEIEIAHENR